MTLAIAHLLSSFGLGGQERVALELAIRHRDAGHRVIAVSMSADIEAPMAAAFAAEDIPAMCVGKDGRSGLEPRLVARLAQLFWKERVDVVHTHNPRPLIYGPIAARLGGSRVVHTKHGRNPSRWANRLLRRSATPLLSSFVCVSRATAAHAVEHRECLDTQLRVIPNGIDLERFSPSPGTSGRIRQQLGIPDSAFVFGTIGRLDANKNHQAMIAALTPSLGPDCRLVIVGDGELRDQLRSRARSSGLDTVVHFAGLRDDVPAVLSAFDAFVLSSKSEGLPIAVLEAMACGLPVVSTICGGIAELVEDGENGLLVASDDTAALASACAALKESKSWARLLGQAGRKRATSLFGAQRMADRYLELYQEAAVD